MPDGRLSIALPRTRHHLQLLLDNGEAPDLVLNREEAMTEPLERSFPGRVRWIGRERRPGLTPGSILAARRANRKYYALLGETLRTMPARRLILFLEGEPLERFVIRQFPGVPVELWEDGLSHYVDLTSPLWYGTRAAIQAASGFYRGGTLARRIDRSGIRVRDRFDEGSLTLTPPPTPPSIRDELLFVGSPLVEDGIVGARRFVQAMRVVVAGSPWPVRYLAHPREDRAALALRLASASPAIRLDDGPSGLQMHVGRYGYRAYLAGLSTGLLDIDRRDRSVFVPGLFGLKRAARVLAAWPKNPIPLAGDAVSLQARLESMAVAPY